MYPSNVVFNGSAILPVGLTRLRREVAGIANPSMNRLAAVFAAVLVTVTAAAQTTDPQKPKPGTILDRPESGRITAPTPVTPTPAQPGTGQRVERFEAVGNT